MSTEPTDLLKLEYAGANPETLKAIAAARALIEQARQIQDQRQAAGYTRNISEVTRLREELMDARRTAVIAVARARTLIQAEGS